MQSASNAATECNNDTSEAFTAHFDHSLIAQMRPHQVSAAKFIMNRLIGCDESTSSEKEDEGVRSPGDEVNRATPVTGAILADGEQVNFSIFLNLWLIDYDIFL